VQQSVLAVEVADYYDHNGVNVKAVPGAGRERRRRHQQGRSTITQQLVKNAILNSNQDFGRKSKEASIAIRLEQKIARIAELNGAPDPTKVAKDVILNKYLNTVYFGSGAYGVQAAAETYWGKPVNELGWAEGAMLAALIANPVGYDPTLHPETAKKQRQIALDRLVHLNRITPAQARSLGQAPVPTSVCSVSDASSTNCGNLQLPEEQGYFARGPTTAPERSQVQPRSNTGTTRCSVAAECTPRSIRRRRPWPSRPWPTSSPRTTRAWWAWSCRSSRRRARCACSWAARASRPTSTTSPPTPRADRPARRSRPSR
jgi:hypothetical protein